MEKPKKTKKTTIRPWMVITAAILLILVLAIGLWVRSVIKKTEIPELQELASEAATEVTEQTEALETAPVFTAEELSDGLYITDVGSYAGVYMEDGSDETVSDVMMLVLENASGKDLQLARIQLVYGDFTAEFETTNVPAGESVVLLEKNRHSAPQTPYQSAEASVVAFFDEPMSLQEDRLRITGMDGVLEVTNISEADITGDVFIYYKNAAADLLYGGITYRVRVNGGIAAGETAQITTGHYTQAGSRILWVTCAE